MFGSHARTAAGAAVLYLGTLLLTGCPGTNWPTHDGYRSSQKAPWKRPKKLTLDRDGEAEIDDRVNYAERKRAKWYSVETRGDGNLSFKLEITPGTEYADFDLGFEVYNSRYKVLHRSDKEASDVGELKKTASVTGLPQGKYLIHVFLQGRSDRASYYLRVKYDSGKAKYSSNFPANVKFPTSLAAVPLFESFSCERCSCRDDKCRSSCNKCSFCNNCSCRAWKCRKSCPGKCKRVVVRPRPRINCSSCDCEKNATCKRACSKCKKTNTGPPAGVVYGSIIGLINAGGGTRITINRGQTANVASGWKGMVVDKKGTPIPGGAFRVENVSTRRCYGVVKAPLEQVSKAGRVRLSP